MVCGVRRGWQARVIVGLTTLAGVVSIGLAACGGGQTRGHPLDSSWSDEDGSELAAFQSTWRLSAPDPPIDVAVGVVDDRTLIGRATGARNSWRYEHLLESRPVIAGSVVIGIGGDELFALDAESGRLIWTRQALGRMRGASDDGVTTLVSLESLSGSRSIVLAIDRNGKVLRQLYLEASIGRPLVADAYAFLPYNRTMVLVYDLLEGSEVARVVADFPVSHAFRIGSDVYFGEASAVRFDRSIVAARRGAGSRVQLPSRDFPRRPAWNLPASMAPPVEATRDDTIRLYARPETTDDGPPTLSDYALSYFSLTVGLDAPSGRTRWVQRGDHVILGGFAGVSSLALCDASGAVRWLDRTTGAELERDALGQALIACVVQSEAPPRPVEPLSRPALSGQLARALADPRAELTPLQRELLAELDELQTDSATEHLLTLASADSEASAAIRDAATQRLARRRTGLPALLDGLRRDALRPALSPSPLPLEAIAKALTGLDSAAIPEATELLIDRLGDRTVAPPRAVALAETLETLVKRGARPLPPVERRALVHYLAKSICGGPELDRAVLAVARTLVWLGQRAPVAQAAHGACDRDALKASLQAVLGVLESGAEPATP
jgi:outer membrane protein assembly factor BamB